MNKRLLSMFLALCMVLTILPVSAMAKEVHTTIGGGGEIIEFVPMEKTEKKVGAADLMILSTAGDVAKIGSTGYATLQAAVNAVANDETIDFLDNITLTSTVTIAQSNPANFTLNLNGKTLDSGTNHAIDHRGTGTLTITDDSSEANGNITSKSMEGTIRLYGSNINVVKGMVENTTINTAYAYAIRIYGGNVNISGGTVRGNCYALGNLSTGTVNVSGGSVISDTSIAIHNSKTGAVNINGSGRVSAASMAIANSSTGKITISDMAVLSGNTDMNDRGTIWLNSGIDSETILEISGGTIENTNTYGTAIYNGGEGIISIPSGSPVIKGRKIAMNKAPDLSGYANVKVTASGLVSGTSHMAYDPATMNSYKYLTFEINTDNMVTIKNLTDKLAAPVTGSTPATVINESAQYTGTVTWNSYSSKFLGNTAYTAIVNLTAKEGYSFCGMANNSFTYAGVTSVSNLAGYNEKLTVKIVFPETAVKELESISISRPPTKTTYKYGETFSPAGMRVKATYNDGTENANFVDYTVDKEGALTMSDTIVTVTANDTSITTTQSITINKADGPAITCVSAVNCTTINNDDGMLIGVTSAMEYKKNSDESYTTVSGSAISVSGSAITGLTNGDYLVRVAETATHKAGPDSLFTVGLFIPEPTYTITGTILANDTNSAIAGAFLQLKSGGINIGSSVFTDLSGTFIISNVPAGTYTIEVSADGYVSGSISNIVVANESVSGKDLTLTKTITFIPVKDISMVNANSVQVNTNLVLAGIISPETATNHSITWSVESANNTGATITGNTFRATSAGTATMKATIVNGLTPSSDYTKTFTITVTAAPIVVPDPSPSYSTGNTEKTEGKVEKTEQRNDGAPVVNVTNSSDELKDSVLTPQDQEMVARGENAKIVLKVTDISTSVNGEEKKLIEENLASENKNADISVLYVDLSLYKQIGKQEQIQVTESKGKISISIEVPERLRNTDVTKNRVFYIIRIHDKEATRIEGSYDPVTHLFTFETDRFSTYALAYQDASKIQTYHGFHYLQLTAKANKTSQTLSYQRIANVDGYLIYGAKCGEEMTQLAKVTADTTSYTVKGLKQGTYYKYQVKAYRIIDGKQVIIVSSKVIHSITESKTYGNTTKVTSSTSSVTLAKGKSKTVTSQVVLPKGKKQKEHTAAIRYESSDKAIATVNSKGKITAKTKGSCYVYAYAQNGVYKRIKVMIK